MQSHGSTRAIGHTLRPTAHAQIVRQTTVIQCLHVTGTADDGVVERLGLMATKQILGAGDVIAVVE